MPPPWVVLAAVVTGVIGVVIGHRKGYPVWGFFVGFLLSVIGLVILLCIKPDREAQVRREQDRMQIQAEAARRAGFIYPAEPPYGPGQYASQPPPGQWELPSAPTQ